MEYITLHEEESNGPIAYRMSVICGREEINIFVDDTTDITTLSSPLRSGDNVDNDIDEFYQSYPARLLPKGRGCSVAFLLNPRGSTALGRDYAATRDPLHEGRGECQYRRFT